MTITGTAAEASSRPRAERIATSPQWRGSHFANAQPEHHQVAKSIVKWLRGARDREPSVAVPSESRRAADFERSDPRPRVTWLGHSTTLIELGGARFLTDPVWSKRCAPSEHLGPFRFFDPPLPLSQLPDLDAVVLSHDHYDHLDRRTIKALAKRVPRWVCPLGVGRHLERWGVPARRIIEADWWEDVTLNGVRMTCTPARHFSGRSAFGRNRTLWSGWTFQADAGSVYFGGDSGMQRAFAEIGERLGPFDLSLIEIGAYDQTWADIHLGPEQAIQALQDARGGVLLPVHWGTFNLALHPWTEPGERIIVAAEKAGVPLALPLPGGQVEAHAPLPVTPWWPSVPWRGVEDDPIISAP